jgi:protein-S-isoprenylcysteine O-methyltransferase Ste14
VEEETLSAIDRSSPARAPRTAADWIGCLFFCAFALTIPLTAGQVGLLLLPPMAYEIVVAATFLIRGRARRTLPGIWPRVAAYGATFLIPVFLWCSSRWAPQFVESSTAPALRFAGAFLWLFGTVLSFWPIWYLRRSFSIEPAARELTTSGPYNFARHPIYGTQILEYTGIWMLHATVPFALVLVAWIAVVRVRVGYEERVLSAEFDTYAQYKGRVWAFGPALVPHRSAGNG